MFKKLHKINAKQNSKQTQNSEFFSLKISFSRLHILVKILLANFCLKFPKFFSLLNRFEAQSLGGIRSEFSQFYRFCWVVDEHRDNFNLMFSRLKFDPKQNFDIYRDREVKIRQRSESIIIKYQRSLSKAVESIKIWSINKIKFIKIRVFDLCLHFSA